MKIKKLSNINNAFSYSSFDWDDINLRKWTDKQGIVQQHEGLFSKNNIFFAENGNGKSKLVKILKSLNNNTNNIDPHKDHKLDPQKIKIILDDGSEINYSGTWSNNALQDKFIFFDKTYIDNFVHSTGSDTEDTTLRRQQRGKNIVYLGQFFKYNIEIDRINELKNNIIEKNNLLQELETQKINTLFTTTNVKRYDLLQNREKINALDPESIENKETSLIGLKEKLQKLAQALKQKNNITSLEYLSKSLANFSLHTTTTTDNELIELNPNDLFSFTVAKGVENTLHNIANKKEFIQEGISKISESTNLCPFCEQPIKNGDFIKIIKNYKEIFNSQFTTEEKNVRTLLSTYKSLLENLLDLQILSNNQKLLENANKYISIDEKLPNLSLEEEDRGIIKAELKLIDMKEAQILTKLDGCNIDKIKKIITKANEMVNKYNDCVTTINKKIKQIQEDSKKGKLETQKADLEKEINKIDVYIFYAKNKALFTNYYKIIDQYEKNKEITDGLEIIYQLMKEKILTEFKEFVNEYFDLMKQYIKEISPSMDILDITGNATIDRRNIRESAQCGFRVEYNKEEFTGNLSEGEKQVIALAYFFAHLKKDSNKNKIVVLDDPITSFDTGKRKSTAELIARETKEYNQLYILTCDPLFREYCLKEFSDRSFYYIFKTLGSSSIHYYKTKDVNEFINLITDKFEDDFKNINKFNGDDENIVILGQKLRFCLETKVKEKYFGYSQDKFSLMIEQVAKNDTENINKLINNKDIILEIYRYCNTGGLAHFPKDGSTSWNELKDKITKYLALEL